MVRLILAFILAPIVWGVVMFGGTLLIGMVFPDVGASGPFPTGYLVLALLGSVIYSLVAGLAAGDRARLHGGLGLRHRTGTTVGLLRTQCGDRVAGALDPRDDLPGAALRNSAVSATCAEAEKEGRLAPPT